jgi:hypothetical protein
MGEENKAIQTCLERVGRIFLFLSINKKIKNCPDLDAKRFILK